MTAPVWRLEWRIALRRRRLLALDVGVPLALALPLAFGGAPPFHAAAALSVLFVLFGTFGSAIPLLREGEAGLLRRLVLSGAPTSRLLGERILAGAALDFAQLLPSLVVVLAAWRPGSHVWLAAPPVLLLTLLAANLIGVWVAAVARSLAEGALFAAVVSLFVLHGSGVFRSSPPGGIGAALEATLPFGPLHHLLLAAGGAAPAPAADWAFAVSGGSALLLFAATLVVSARLLERIAPPVP